MLGWMLNRGGRASEAPDDNLVDQPDTPAPVFAARALKSALFGTPAPAATTRSEKSKKHQQTANAASKSSANAPALGTPAKQRPQSILLTPGVGTARRKRVSFDQDVAPADGKNGSKSGLPDDCPGKFPSPWVAPAQADDGEDSAAARRPRTSLTEKLENSRKFKPQPRQQDAEGNKAKPAPATNIFSTKSNTEERASDVAEAIWEDDDDQPDASDRERDVTVDLNEPCSGSGRFWKSEYTRYHDEARAEMEKLVRYKNLAKSYAKIKDGEALELNKRLSEEQAKVAAMETQVAELTRRIAKSHMCGNGGGGANDEGDQAEILRDLTRQATLATQYRTQVKELEAIIKEGQAAAAAGSPDPETPRRRNGSRVVSPRSNQALIESQRQLKRAREQVRELEGLKSDLRAVERRVDEMQSAKERAEAELDESKAKAKDAAAKLAVVEERARRKTEALEQLQEDHSKLRDESRKAAREAKAELRAKNEEIARLKKALESNKPDPIAVGQAASEHSDDVPTPYTPGPADVDWTVNVTQMELEQGTPNRMVGRRHKATEVSQPVTPLREEPRSRRQARAPVAVTYDEPPKAPADDAPVDMDDSTPRAGRRVPKLDDPRPTERQQRASRRVTTNDEDIDKEDWTRRLDQIKPNLDTPQPSERRERASRRTMTRSDAPEEAKPAVTRHFRRSSAAASDDEALGGGGGGESSLRERLRSHSRTAQRFFTTAATATATRSRRRRDSATGLSEREDQNEDAVTHGDDDDLFKPRPVRHSADAGMLGGSAPRTRPTTRRTSSSRPDSSVEPSSRPADAESERRTTRTASTATNSRADEEEPQIDLLADRFARLGGGAAAAKAAPRTEAVPDTSMAATVGNTTRSTTLPPDRHAAAMARLQKRREERRRALDKENIRP
ncbi:hypothetical protein MAPG_01843 [Magnaporthiopsis poae ATCC 64411]|uniref:Spindle pole body-associated protein cut12 domain-containing protein n=1 Tax=Magnaporthiopsis poae (strain ATCC 64411 / 73-15) TaxID=644358 RepID=A0A0C4DPS2_MAGP6|nr:hypothetical protein MAPG_01843 [Magnaporthiopsis poae ATCC 64411]